MAAFENESISTMRSTLRAFPTNALDEGFMGDLKRWYATVLIIMFIVTSLVYSISTSKVEEGAVTSTIKGPGGKPLPVNKRRKQSLQGSSQALGRSLRLPKIGTAAKRAFRLLSSLVFSVFVVNGVAIGVHSWQDNRDAKVGEVNWWCGEPMVMYILGGGCIHLYFTVTLFEWKDSPSIGHILVWSVAGIMEMAIFLVSFTKRDTCDIFQTEKTKFDGRCFDNWKLLDLVLSLGRVTLLIGLVCIYSSLWVRTCPNPPVDKETNGFPDNASQHSEENSEEHSDASDSSDTAQETDPEESTPLMNGHASRRTYSTQRPTQHTRSLSHAATLANCAETSRGLYKDEQAAFYRPEKLPKRNWWEYLRGYALFWPYLWPKDQFWLKIRIFFCFILLVLQRIVNIYLPFQIGQLTYKLSNPTEGDTMGSIISALPWVPLWTVNILMLMQGQAGLLGSVRSIIWIKVSQHSYRSLETAAFQHVHSLSLDFHLGKRTGEVLSALNKGGAINTFLEQVTFQLIPMIFDLFLAIYFFNHYFDATYGTIISVNVFWYLYLTIKMAQTRADQRREMTNADREEEAVKNDSITSYETVKYFNAEVHEFRRYEDAIDQFQRAEAKVSYGTNMMTIVQILVYTGGQAVALMVGAFQVWNGFRNVGDFVTLMAYLTQMQAPLNFFGQFYRVVQQALISGERLLELFKIQPSVRDPPHAQDLHNCGGRIRWKGVRFSYGSQTALRNLNFECAPGTTTAFVGESGGGKSTVFRLMFRYYNCSEGSIEIDGHDVKDLTIDSVRRFIGVVPQDTILFNETLMYNLKYARPGCTDEEVYAACRAASIHDKIMKFPGGYSTKVGERGLRLSGGEKQRVAIARTILKNPKIIMLDEATSALDSRTEQNIQKEFTNVGEGRTVLIIAHRLSTITHADQIIVLNQGEIAEKGTHEELISLRGYYHAMWEKQAQATRAANRECRRLLRKGFPLPQQHQDGYDSMASSAILADGQTSPLPFLESPTRRRDDHSSSDGESSSRTLAGDLDKQ